MQQSKWNITGHHAGGHDQEQQGFQSCHEPSVRHMVFLGRISSMDTWRLLITPPAHGAWNMALDESILEHIGRGEFVPTLRLYAWDPPCLSLGHAQPFADVDLLRLREHGWEVVRRATGGRAILHTDEITYSVIAPNDEPRVAGTVLESYNRLALALLLAVKELELPVEMKQGRVENNSMLNPVCFEVPSTYEITVNGKKLIGSAQARRKRECSSTDPCL